MAAGATLLAPADSRPTEKSAPSAAIMSVDVEDWFQVENLRSVIPRQTWGERQLRVERNTDRMLQLMEHNGVHGTWFVLGWVADRCPSLVKRIAAAGHEVASHGYGHDLVDSISREAFRDDVERSKATIEDLTGEAVHGYRAPSFSITQWAIPILEELGFSYDSSFFPAAAHDRYGRLEGIPPGRSVTELSPGFFEISVSCNSVGSLNVPWGGGGYFRLLPYPLFRNGVRRILRSGRPYVFYIHPWEIDPLQPRMSGLPRAHRFRHYVGLTRCEDRFASLLRDFSWTTMSGFLDRRRDGSA